MTTFVQEIEAMNVPNICTDKPNMVLLLAVKITGASIYIIMPSTCACNDSVIPIVTVASDTPRRI